MVVEYEEQSKLMTLVHAIEARVKHHDPDLKAIARIAGQLARKAAKLHKEQTKGR